MRASSTRATRALRGCAVLIVALGFSACSALGPSVVRADPPPPAAVSDQWAGCEATGAFTSTDDQLMPPFEGPPGTGAIPADFEAVSASLCATDTRPASSGDLVDVQLERHSDDIGSLLDYLAQPSQDPTDPDETVCPAMAQSRPWLFLRDADGQWLAPAIPHDVCGFALNTFTSSGGPVYTTMTWKDRVVREGRIVESSRARELGCEMEWKNMVAVEADTATHRSITVPASFATSEITVCTYAVSRSEQKTDAPAGTFTGAGVLTGAQRQLVRAELGSAPPARPCDLTTGEFAVLRSSGDQTVLYVELDGCRRVLDPGTVSGYVSMADAGAITDVAQSFR